MYLDWTSLVMLCFAGAVIWFWQDSLAARENANAAALEACNGLGLQLLDGTVAFARIGLGRGRKGRLQLRRTYVFDYTANSIERRQGFVVLSGRRVDTVGYAQEDERGSARAKTAAPAGQAQAPAKVLNLEDWRTRPRDAPQSKQETDTDSSQ